MLEELLALGHGRCRVQRWLVKIGEGDQFGSGFVAVNPNSKIPALLDRSGPKPIRVFETRRDPALSRGKVRRPSPPTDPDKRTEALNWLFWQMGSAPYPRRRVRAFLRLRADARWSTRSTGIAMEAKRQHGCARPAPRRARVLRRRRSTRSRTWRSGPGTVRLRKELLYGSGEFLDVQSYKHVNRWTEAIGTRPAVKRGRMVNRVQGDPESQLRERHDAGDFETKTQDKLAEYSAGAPVCATRREAPPYCGLPSAGKRQYSRPTKQHRRRASSVDRGRHAMHGTVKQADDATERALVDFRSRISTSAILSCSGPDSVLADLRAPAERGPGALRRGQRVRPLLVGHQVQRHHGGRHQPPGVLVRASRRHHDPRAPTDPAADVHRHGPAQHDVQRKTGSADVRRPTSSACAADPRAAGQILDSLPIDEFDWVDKVSIELTTMTLATLFDFPWEDRRKLTRWSDVAPPSRPERDRRRPRRRSRRSCRVPRLLHGALERAGQRAAEGRPDLDAGPRRGHAEHEPA